MDVEGVLSEAWKAVQSSAIPEHLQAVAFEQAVRLLTENWPPPSSREKSSDAGAAQGSMVSRQNANATGTDSPAVAVANDDDFFKKFSEESGIDSDKLRSVYYIKDGQVRLSLPRRRLGDTEADKNRTIATLVAAAAWYVEGKANLDLKDIREAAKALGHDPSRNLSTQLERLPGTQSVGAARDRAIRVQTGRFDEPFKNLIERLTAV